MCFWLILREKRKQSVLTGSHGAGLPQIWPIHAHFVYFNNMCAYIWLRWCNTFSSKYFIASSMTLSSFIQACTKLAQRVMESAFSENQKELWKRFTNSYVTHVNSFYNSYFVFLFGLALNKTGGWTTSASEYCKVINVDKINIFTQRDLL